MGNVMKRANVLATVVALFFGFVTLAEIGPAQGATIEQIEVYSDGEKPSKLMMAALVKAFETANPSINVSLNIGPAGVESVELVKSRVAQGTMDDVFLYYTGSLFQAINPTRNLVDLTNEPWHGSVLKSFYPAVSVGNVAFGAPLGSAMGGGILYNKTIYKKYGLRIPLTWKQFMANNAVLKSAGITPVIQTYKDSWTAQLLILADGFNLLSATPNFPALLTANRVQFATTPAALAGFKHLEEINKLGYTNDDYKTIALSKGLEYLATGKGAHYPMLTFVDTELSTKFPSQAKNIGIFAQPGTSTSKNGLTVWMPNGLFIPKSTKHLEAAKKFVAFATSPLGLAAIQNAVIPSGPYMVAGAKLTGEVSFLTRDMLKYFKRDGRTAPALEFLTPVKGPNLPRISVQVGSGELSGTLGAITYDNDVRAESQRLGLPGWGRLG
jgi:raffinose/stachyose/melibiose transport system substrate-binding protein